MTVVKLKPRLARIREVWDKTGGACFYCGDRVPCGGFGFVAEHIVSGNEDPDNIVPACNTCNISKRDDVLSSFRSRLGSRKGPVPVFSEGQHAYLATMGAYPPRVRKYKFWFETSRGKDTLRLTLSPDALARLRQIVWAAEYAPDGSTCPRVPR